MCNDHDYLKWLLSLTESSCRLTGFRLRLSEFDFAIQYLLGHVHQVPNAFSRLLLPKTSTKVRKPVVDDLPNFEIRNVDQPRPLTGNTFVTTIQLEFRTTTPRSTESATELNGLIMPRPATALAEMTARPADAASKAAKELDLSNGDVWDDCDDIYRFDLSLLRPGDDEPFHSLPAALRREDLVSEQRSDHFCQNVLWRQSDSKCSGFFENRQDKVLKQKPRSNPARVQIVIPETICPRLLLLKHSSTLAAHAWQSRMFNTLSITFNWPQMVAETTGMVSYWLPHARNRVKPRDQFSRLKLFPATWLVEAAALHIFEPLPRSRTKKHFLLVKTDRFHQADTSDCTWKDDHPYRRSRVLLVMGFQYGIPVSLLSDYNPQFAPKLLSWYVGCFASPTSTHQLTTPKRMNRWTGTAVRSSRCYGTA